MFEKQRYNLGKKKSKDELTVPSGAAKTDDGLGNVGSPDCKGGKLLEKSKKRIAELSPSFYRGNKRSDDSRRSEERPAASRTTSSSLAHDLLQPLASDSLRTTSIT